MIEKGRSTEKRTLRGGHFESATTSWAMTRRSRVDWSELLMVGYTHSVSMGTRAEEGARRCGDRRFTFNRVPNRLTFT